MKFTHPLIVLPLLALALALLGWLYSLFTFSEPMEFQNRPASRFAPVGQDFTQRLDRSH